MVRLQTMLMAARFALRLQVLPRSPTVSMLRQILPGVGATQRAELAPLECRKIFQSSVENFARKEFSAAFAVYDWF